MCFFFHRNKKKTTIRYRPPVVWPSSLLSSRYHPPPNDCYHYRTHLYVSMTIYNTTKNYTINKNSFAQRFFYRTLINNGPRSRPWAALMYYNIILISVQDDNNNKRTDLKAILFYIALKRSCVSAINSI